MIGSHNSMSYLPPKNLWGKITRLWNKCQDKTIEEQFNSGDDYFDIRINFYSDNNWHFVHNRVDYGIIDKTIWKYIGETNLQLELFMIEEVNLKIVLMKHIVLKFIFGI